jgi:hypothetical protein
MNQEDRELLIRIDERTNSFHQALARIEIALLNKVDNDQAYKDMRGQVGTMWDLKNKAIGYVAGWAAFISIAVTIIYEYLKSNLWGK